MLTVTIPKTMGFSNGMKLLDMMPTGYDLSATFRTDLPFAFGIFPKKTKQAQYSFYLYMSYTDHCGE